MQKTGGAFLTAHTMFWSELFSEPGVKTAKIMKEDDEFGLWNPSISSASGVLSLYIFLNYYPVNYYFQLIRI